MERKTLVDFETAMTWLIQRYTDTQKRTGWKYKAERQDFDTTSKFMIVNKYIATKLTYDMETEHMSHSVFSNDDIETAQRLMNKVR